MPGGSSSLKERYAENLYLSKVGICVTIGPLKKDKGMSQCLQVQFVPFEGLMEGHLYNLNSLSLEVAKDNRYCDFL